MARAARLSALKIDGRLVHIVNRARTNWWPIGGSVSIRLLVRNFVSIGISKLSEQNDQKVDERPNAKAADRDQLKYARTDFADVEAMGSEDTKKECQDRAQNKVLVTLTRRLRFDRCSHGFVPKCFALRLSEPIRADKILA